MIKMKNYGLDQKKFIEQALYRIAQLRYYLLQHIVRSKENRNHNRYTYNRFFKPHAPISKFDYSIPRGKHCNPTCVITSDLILRENLPQLKHGLIKLLKKHYSHKFWGVHRSIEDILDSIEKMDDTLTWSYTSIDVGRFDFDSLPQIASFISYFDLHIRKVNDSYLSVESHIYFSEDFTKELQQIINSDITEQKTYINLAFRRNNKQSGGRRTFSLCNYNEANQKSDEIFEKVTSVKWLFYTHLHRFFRTELHNLGIIPPGIIFYQTNIDYTDRSADHFWYSLGISYHEGQFIDSGRKLFFEMGLSGRYPQHFSPDLIYIYHDEKIPLEAGIYSLNFQIVHYFCWDYSRDFFRFLCLEALNKHFSQKLIQYKHQLNKIKLKRSQLHGLLKLRYKYERDMDMYVRYTSDSVWDNAKKTIENMFDQKTLCHGYDYRFLINLPMASMKRIRNQMSVLTNDFESKAAVLQHLEEYKHESRARLINYISFFIAALTLILLIFPDWSISIAEFLKNMWNGFGSFLSQLGNSLTYHK